MPRRVIRHLVRLAACVAALATGALSATAPAEAIDAAATAEDAATYIVTLAPGNGSVAEMAVDQLSQYSAGALPGHVYTSALRGYTAELTPSEAEALAADPAVEAIERDARVQAFDVQRDPPWGLDRIDQRGLPLDDAYRYDADGTGVEVYVVDTGMRFTHEDFGGRAVSGIDIVDGGRADDCNGHGTHVSSTIGGSTYGVAKRVDLVAVRVLDCSGSGSWSGVIAGIDWIVRDHRGDDPAVANFSIGGAASPATDTAIRRLHADGVTVAAAAGNAHANACGVSPARVPSALTVAASDREDTFAGFSNHSRCVDIIAPGVAITGAWIGSDTAQRTISGTSMASPHVAGVAAKLLDGAPRAAPDTIATEVLGAASRDRISSVPNATTPNLLLYTDT